MYRWSTLALPQVEWPAQATPPSLFRHLHTTVDTAEMAHVREVGYTTWQSIDRGPPVRLGWDWALIDDGVVVLADPMAINSNLRFLHDGVPHSSSREAMQLNAMVHALPWQATILKALRRLRGEQPGRPVQPPRRRRDDRQAGSVAMALP